MNDQLAPAKRARRSGLKNVALNLLQEHRLRQQLRGPSGFRFVIADGIKLLDGAQWDALVQEQSFFLQRDYLLMMEQAGPENLEPRYVMIYDGEQAVAALAMQIATVEGQRLGKSRTAEKTPAKNPLSILKQALQPAARSLQAGLRERILVCGNLLSYGFHGIAFAEHLSEAGKAAVWPAIAESLYRVRRAEKLSGQTDFILIKDLTPTDFAASEILAKLSYRAVETEPNMVLELAEDWRSHDDYLAAMQSKYRSSVKQQVFKPIQAAGLRVEHLQDVAAHAQRLHELYMQVHNKADLRLMTLPEVYFPALAQVAGEDCLCSVIWREQEILGFMITIRDGETAYGYHIGYDTEVAASEKLPLYLRLLHASVADACQLGCRRLSLGRTALEPKAGLGAKPETIQVWIRHRQPVMNVFVRNLLGVVQHEEAPERNPFKK